MIRNGKVTRIIRICLKAISLGAFRFKVGDFKKSGFSFNRGTKRSQYTRIGEYFNKG